MFEKLRIIERKYSLPSETRYVVQTENGSNAYNQIAMAAAAGQPWYDLASFDTVEKAKVYKYQRENQVGPNERIVG